MTDRETINLNFEAYEETTEYDYTTQEPVKKTGKWIGVALLSDDPILWAHPAKDKDSAISRAKRSFITALYCDHKWNYSHDDHEQCQHTGRDYKVKVFVCSKCGLRDTHELEDES